MSLGSGLSIYDQPVMKCDYANLAIYCIYRRFSYQFCCRVHGVGATLIRLFSNIILFDCFRCRAPCFPLFLKKRNNIGHAYVTSLNLAQHVIYS